MFKLLPYFILGPKRKGEETMQEQHEHEIENNKFSTAISTATKELEIVLHTDHKKPQQPLTGAIICLSGLTGEQRKYIRTLIQDLGGRCSSTLKIRQQTHLIASSVTSEKYKAVKEKAPNSIKIVTSDWVEACAREYMWVDETPYYVTDTWDHEDVASIPTQPVAPTTIIGPSAKVPSCRKRKHGLHVSPQTTNSRTAVTALPHHLTSRSITQFQQIYERMLLLQPCCIFSRYEFFVISIVTAGHHHPPGQQQQHHPSKNRAEAAVMASPGSNQDNKCIQILHKLIRHGLGTRYDELHQDVSHLLVITDIPYMDRDLEHALKQLVLSHPRRPCIVTPEWIIACLTQGVILSPQDYPLPPPRPLKTTTTTGLNNTTLPFACTNGKGQRSGTSRYVMGNIDVNSGLRQTNTPHDRESTTSSTFHTHSSIHPTEEKRSKDSLSLRRSSSIFRGLTFIVANVTETWAHQSGKAAAISNEHDIVSFDVSTIRGVMELHGGQLLTKSCLTVLMEKAKERNKQQSPVICYVVVIGAIPTQCNNISKNVISISDILDLGIKDSALLNIASDSRFQSSIRFQLVTPLWVNACVEEGTVVRPEEFIFFQPLTWNMKRLPMHVVVPSCKEGGTIDSKDSTMKLRVAVSGFVGAEREGLLQTLQAIGAVYTNNLKISNTHLISKAREGAKYNRAVEWGIHVVTVDWLYHIARYGYFGKNGRHGTQKGLLVGCEDQFSLVKLTGKKLVVAR